MTSPPSSPKRRHFLNSMNPENATGHPDAAMSETPASPTPSGPSGAAEEQGASSHGHRASRFRFKAERPSRRRCRRSRSRHDEDDRRDAEEEDATAEPADGTSRPHSSSSRPHRDRRHHHRRHHKRRRRRSRSPAGDNGGGRGATTATAGYGQPFAEALSPDAAFRESLFDAMADDEGAAYWEGVYGQPIHVYGREDGGGSGVDDGGNGELDRMTDEEYATFVRRKMWEKTHAGLLEERARREAARAAREREEAEAERIAAEVERSLRRGRERKSRREWTVRWEGYGAAWAAWGGDVEGLPWPTRSGSRTDVAAEGAVREFFVMGLDLDRLGEKEFAARLKDERVRWHPDKVQQKLGGQVDDGVMRDVTAIFQIIDKLWSDTRSN